MYLTHRDSGCVWCYCEESDDSLPYVSPRNGYQRKLKRLKKIRKLEAHYTKEQRRNQQRWTTLSPQQRKQYNEKSMIRMRQYHARKKELSMGLTLVYA